MFGLSRETLKRPLNKKNSIPTHKTSIKTFVSSIKH